jgi:MFS family permease
MSEPAAAAEVSPWAPLRSRVFAVLWAATLISNIGSWMRDVGAGWLMTELAPSPLMVAMVQAAGTLPIFLFSLPAGALSDLLDRRTILLCSLTGMLVTSIAMAVLTGLGLMTPGLLLTCVLIAGIGSAVNAPVWQSLVPEIVGKAELKDAVALNSMGINVARAIGPAVGGALIVSFGVVAAFFADALSYAAVLAALLWWKRKPIVRSLPPERLLPAIIAAGRYARASPPLKRTLLRTALFFSFGSAPWALLPLLAREDFGGSAAFYGMLLGGIGAGAVGGALVLPKLRRHLSPDSLVLTSTLFLSAVSLGLALTDAQAIALLLMPLLGLCWIAVLTSLNVTAQAILPNWVRGRGLALYLTAFYGAMTAGSLVWGHLAEVTSTQTSLAGAALLGAAVALGAARLRLPAGAADLSPSMHWPEPSSSEEGNDTGPVMITVEYQVEEKDVPAFGVAVEALGLSRRRDGAYAWGVFRDTEVEGRHLEYFLVASWLDHMRQHQRVSHADQALQAEIRLLHAGSEPPKVTHYVALAQA